MTNRFALLIGNSSFDYDTQFPALSSPIQDVKELAAVLKDPKIGNFQVSTLFDATHQTIKEALDTFLRDKKLNDVLLIYYSGHGKIDEQGQLFLTAKDTDPSRLILNGLPSSFVKVLLERCRSKTVVLILDCCYGGAFTRGSKSEVGQTVNAGVEFGGTGSGRAILTATSATQLAWTGEHLEGEPSKSVFSHFLIQGLKTGEADKDQNGHITLDEWYEYAYENVLTHQTQSKPMTPHMTLDERVGQSILIAKNPRKIILTLPKYIINKLQGDISRKLEGIVELYDITQQGDAMMTEAALQALQNMTKDDHNIVSGASVGALVLTKPELLGLNVNQLDNAPAFSLIKDALLAFKKKVIHLEEQNARKEIEIKSNKEKYDKRFNQLRQEINDKNQTIHDLREWLKALQVPQIRWPQGSDKWPVASSDDVSGIETLYDNGGSSWSYSVRIRTYLGELGYLTVKCLSAVHFVDYYATSFSVQLTQTDIISSGAFVNPIVYTNNTSRYQKLGGLVSLTRGSQLSLSGRGVVVDINLFDCSGYFSNGYSQVLFHISIHDNWHEA